MIQLDLFGAPRPAMSEIAPPAEPEVEPAIKLVDPDQMDLFDARLARFREGRAAVAREELDRARSIFAELAAHGDDPVAAGALARIAAVSARMDATRGLPAPAGALALLACADELDDAGELRDALRAALLRRAARMVQAESGDDALLAGWPVGVYYARAGDLAAARASLTAALSRTRRTRTMYALGDVAALEGKLAAARDCYCEALVGDPFDVPAISAIRDPAIVELPDIARYELDIDPCPEAWSAPLGMILGVFRIPRDPTAPGLPAEAPRSREQLDALAAAQAFTAALVAATTGRSPDQPGPIPARRVMQRLQPGLFAAYLERRSGALRDHPASTRASPD